MKKKIDVILMAAGLSKRYGKENKLLALYKENPLLQYPLDLLKKTNQFIKIFVVYSANEVEQFLESQKRKIELIKNSHPEIGISESIRLGVLASDADFYMFLPADQPLLSQKTLNNIIDKATVGKIVCPEWEGDKGAPTVFSSVFREDLLSLTGDQGGKYVMKKYPEDVIYIEAADALSLLDIDEKRDLEQLNNQ